MPFHISLVRTAFTLFTCQKSIFLHSSLNNVIISSILQINTTLLLPCFPSLPTYETWKKSAVFILLFPYFSVMSDRALKKCWLNSTLLIQSISKNDWIFFFFRVWAFKKLYQRQKRMMLFCIVCWQSDTAAIFFIQVWEIYFTESPSLCDFMLMFGNERVS